MSTPGHHQDLVLCGTVRVLLRHPAGGIRGVILRVDLGEPALEIAVLSRSWPPGVAEGCRLWARGHLANERVDRLKRATHFVEARVVEVLQRPRRVASEATRRADA